MCLTNGGIMVPPKTVILLFLIVVTYTVNNINGQEDERPGLTPCELESIVRELVYPSEEYSMHATALRNQLRRILESSQAQQRDNFQSLDDIMPGGDDIENVKRNIGALARAGLLKQREQDLLKRSIATLAKSGQLPSGEPDPAYSSDQSWSNDKRNLASLAKSGYTPGKRNIASLARSYDLQSLGGGGGAGEGSAAQRAYNAKRNLASLARSNVLREAGKRNVGALARDWSLPNHQQKMDKREVQSVKNQAARPKRELNYEDFNDEIADQLLQSGGIDYEELREKMEEMYPQYNSKRFLGRILLPTRASTATNRRQL